MGRDIKRKKAQSKTKNELLREKSVKENILNNNSDDNQVKSLFKFLGITVGIVVLTYCIFAIFITKEMDLSKLMDIFKKKENPVVAINYKEILIGQTLNRSESDYYVLFYDFTNDDDVTLEGIVVQTLINNTVYNVNTADEFNKKNITEGFGNRDAKTALELKVMNPTLIRINAGQIVGYIEGVDGILGYLKEV